MEERRTRDEIHHGKNRGYSLPDFSGRNDFSVFPGQIIEFSLYYVLQITSISIP
jgi:hypothetical protein